MYKYRFKNFSLVYKTQFLQLKNDHIEHEPFVHCVDCGRQWHQICALHLAQIWPSGYVYVWCTNKKDTNFFNIFLNIVPIHFCV